MRIYFFTILIFTSIYRTVSFDKQDEVVFLAVIQVEGLKTPRAFYPKLELESLQPERFSQLTNEGKLKQYEVGKWLRARYPSLIHVYYEESVYALSSDFDSAIMSAETLLAGMYLPEGKQIWGPLKWQPIPVHTIPQNLDNLIAMTAECRSYTMELSNYEYGRELFNTDVSYNTLFGYLSEMTGDRIYSIYHINRLCEYLIFQKHMNYSLPDWAEDILPSLKEATVKSLTLPTFTSRMKLLTSGPLISVIMEHTLEKYVKMKPGFELDDDTRSVRVFSVHVETMVSLMNSLGIYNQVIPPYSSTLLWELIKASDDDYRVQISLRNSSSEEPFILQLPGCTARCSMDSMTSLLSKYFEKVDCLNGPSPSENGFYFGKIGIIIISIFITAFFALLGYSCCKKEPKFIYERLQSNEKLS